MLRCEHCRTPAIGACEKCKTVHFCANCAEEKYPKHYSICGDILPRSLTQIVQDSDEHELLAMIIERSTLADSIDTVEGVTLFAPNDAAVAEYLGERVMAAAKQQIRRMDEHKAMELVLLHIVGGQEDKDSLFTTKFLRSAGTQEHPPIDIPVTAIPEWGPNSLDSRGTIYIGNARLGKFLAYASTGLVYNLLDVLQPNA